MWDTQPLWGIKVGWDLTTAKGGIVSTVMDKVRKLIALTESPFEEEARTAAMMAIRLIKEHKILDRVKVEGEPVKMSRQTRSNIRSSAYAKIARFLDFVKGLPHSDSRCYYSATGMVERAVEHGEIDRSDRAVYLYYLRQALRQQVLFGSLEYRAGKGYYLHYTCMWAHAA